jgi:putative Mn2+ efflux pump MntP
MKVEAILFAGTAGFFGVTAGLYGWLSHEWAGTAALVMCALMAALIAFFLATQAVRRGPRPEDDKEGEVRERAGRLDFFPPGSPWPVVSAFGTVLAAIGVVFGLWLIGVGVVGTGVAGFVFQFRRRWV